jgi:glycosyltransferase involved in cell wall biosynthesis
MFSTEMPYAECKANLSISVVIPTYNRAHLIQRALKSVLNQSKLPAEIIVVDDGSTDDTQSLVESYDDIVRYVYQDNAGASAARNNGVYLANSEWVAFLDSDDIWLPSHLNRISNAICSTNGVADLYFDNTIRTNEEGGQLLWEMANFDICGDYKVAYPKDEWGFFERQPMMLQSSVIKRQKYLVEGGLNTSLISREDTHFFYKFCLRNKICAVAGCGVKMTSDDNPSNRLTQKGQVYERGYSMQVEMFTDLLRSVPNLSPKHRDKFRNGLGDAHMNLAKIAYQKKQFGKMFWEMFMSFKALPQKFQQRFLKKMICHIVRIGR